MTRSTTDLARDLVAALRSAHAPEVEPDVDVPETTEGFRVDSEGLANWALRKIAELADEVAHVDAVADEEKARIEAWRAGLAGKAKRSIEFFTAHLEAYAAEHTDEKVRTLHLVAGDLCARKTSQKIEVTDPPALVAWLQAHAPTYLRVADPEPRIADLKAELARDPKTKRLQPCIGSGPLKGEVIPGIAIVGGDDDTYQVKPAALPD